MASTSQTKVRATVRVGHPAERLGLKLSRDARLVEGSLPQSQKWVGSYQIVGEDIAFESTAEYSNKQDAWEDAAGQMEQYLLMREQGGLVLRSDRSDVWLTRLNKSRKQQALDSR